MKKTNTVEQSKENEMKEQESNSTKFEFLLKLNDNIVCQRYFNVRNYNEDSIRSIDLSDEVKGIAESIQDSLRARSIDFLQENAGYFFSAKYKDSETTDNEYFTITIRKDDKNIIERYFDASIYPPKVRYTVDIRPRLRRILKKLTDTLSSKNVTTKYLNYDL